MVLRLVPETEERDSNSPQGRRLTFNGHGHRVSLGWQGRGDCGSPHSPLRHGVSGSGGRRNDPLCYIDFDFFFGFFLHFLF